MRKLWRQFYYFMTKYQGCGFSFKLLISKIQFFKVPSCFPFKYLKYFHNLTSFRLILNFAQEKFKSRRPLGFKTLPILGRLQNLLLPLYFGGNDIHSLEKFKLNFCTFSVRGCWGQPMLLFWKLVDETQMGNTGDHAARDISSKFSIFLPLRAI